MRARATMQTTLQIWGLASDFISLCLQGAQHTHNVLGQPVPTFPSPRNSAYLGTHLLTAPVTSRHFTILHLHFHCALHCSTALRCTATALPLHCAAAPFTSTRSPTNAEGTGELPPLDRLLPATLLTPTDRLSDARRSFGFKRTTGASPFHLPPFRLRPG